MCWPQQGLAFAGALTDPVEAWLRCGPTAARHTVVAGRVIVRDGTLTVPGAEDILARHAAAPPASSASTALTRCLMTACYARWPAITSAAESTRAPALVHTVRRRRQPCHASRFTSPSPAASLRWMLARPRATRFYAEREPAARAPPGTVIAARINGALRDLAAPLAEGDQVEPVEIGSEDGRAILRHSTAHVMAQAVQALFPEAKLGIGPPVEDGFYYDFDVAQPFGPDDLKSIEARMRAIVKQGQRFSRRVVTDVRGPRRTGRGAVQAGACRAQGRCG